MILVNAASEASRFEQGSVSTNSDYRRDENISIFPMLGLRSQELDPPSQLGPTAKRDGWRRSYWTSLSTTCFGGQRQQFLRLPQTGQFVEAAAKLWEVLHPS
jgi:hypothetical protein